MPRGVRGGKFLQKKVENFLNHLLSGVVNSTRVGLPARSFLNENVVDPLELAQKFF
jgi:hypothetical protein